MTDYVEKTYSSPSVLTAPSAPLEYRAHSSNRIYPRLGASEYRAITISKYLDRIDEDIKHRTRMCKRYSSVANASSIVSSVSNTLSLTSGGASVITLATGLGAIVSIPCIAVSIASSVTGLFGELINRQTVKKLTKHQRLLTIANSYKVRIQSESGTAVEDFIINQSESDQIMKMINAYNNETSLIKNKANEKNSTSPTGSPTASTTTQEEDQSTVAMYQNLKSALESLSKLQKK